MSSATEPCPCSAAPWPFLELEAGAAHETRASLPPSSPLGDDGLFEGQDAGDGMAHGPAQSMSPRWLQGLELSDAMRPAAGAARGAPMGHAAWGSAPELAASDAPRGDSSRGSAPHIATQSNTLSSNPASSCAPAQRPQSLLGALVPTQQALDERGRPSSGGVRHQDYARLVAAASPAAAATSASSAGCQADDDDLPVRSPALRSTVLCCTGVSPWGQPILCT